MASRSSRYQARLAFSFYLQHIQRRLMCNMEQVQGSGQLELVLRFIRKAARNLTDAYAIQVEGMEERGTQSSFSFC